MPQYVTIGTLTLNPGQRAQAEAIADQGYPGVAQLPGFVQLTFFLNEERNEYGAVTIWATREDAEAADALLTPQFTQAFGDLATSPIDSRIYEVYTPRTAQ
jgi:heme-degrading monooxygenase HmoA